MIIGKVLNNINFVAKSKAYKNEQVPMGLDYSSVDEFKKSTYSQDAIVIASSEGRMNQEMREQIILERLPKTIEHVKIFLSNYPDIDLDDATQATIEHLVEIANSYSGQMNGNFNLYARAQEEKFLHNLININALEKDLIVCSICDLK